MFENVDIDKIDKIIHEKFPIIYEYEFNGLILLFGGAVKDIIMNRQVKDLDFILLTTKDDEIKKFVEHYNFNCKKLIYKGYKINYNDMDIDLTYTNDLFEAGHLSTDFLFFAVKRKVLIPMGIKDSIKKCTVIDYYYQSYFRAKVRVKKAKKFIEFFQKDNKNIKFKIKYNKIFELTKAFFKHPNRIFRFLSK